MLVLIRRSRADAISVRLDRETGGRGQQRLIEYGIGAQILLDLGVREMLLSNSPARKIVALQGYGKTVAGHRSLGRRRWRSKGPRSVLIIEARFYEDIADELARGAIEELEAHRIAYERIAVPGSLEIALALSLALANGFVGKAGRHRGCIALGCVIRGETALRYRGAGSARPCISSPCSMPCRSVSAS